jgi:ADP-ribosylglycohydrolase
MALNHYEETKDPYSGPTDPTPAGNGSIMRLAPVPLAYAKDFATAVERSGESSKTTHGALEAVDSCRYLGGLIVASVKGSLEFMELTCRCMINRGCRSPV